MIFNINAKKTVLVVDDDEAIRKLCSIVFEPSSINMMEAGDCKSALEMIKANKYDLVLLDVNLPDMNGFDFCKLLKNDKGMKNIPVVLFTADEGIKSVDKGFESGADGYIIKPVNWQLFRKKIGKLLNTDF